MTLLSIVIALTPTEPVELSANLGRATHAWFMDRVMAHDHALAKRLHEPNQERPFTVSNLLNTDRQDKGYVRLTPENQYALRLTSYEPELTALLDERLLPEIPETISLAGCKFMVGRVITPGDALDDRRLEPWVSRTSFESLVAKHTLHEGMPNRVTLRFASPTVFKSKGVFMPLPLPRLVYEGLVRRWNAFSPVQVHPDVNRFAEETMAISRYQLRTETVRFGEDGARGAFPGFTGRCTFVMRQRDRYWMGLVHLLAAFALYAGVGKQTTMGMGQCRAVQPKS